MDARMLWMSGLLLAMLTGCNKSDSATARSDIATAPSAAPASAAVGRAVSPAADARAPAAMPSMPSVPSVPRTRPSNPGYLAGESRLLSGNAVSSSKVDEVFGSSKAFEQALQQFEQDAARHPEAQDLTALYREAATRALGADAVLASLSCGYSVCMGEIRSRSSNGFSDWVDAFGQDSGPPQYALVTAEYPLGKGQSAGRFVFSTDPAANGITQ